MKLKTFALLLVLSTASFSYGAQKNVLFLGNSYTFYNNLPKLVQDIALSAGDSIHVESLTPGGRRISQHATDPMVFDLLRQGSWDYVIIQCQSQEPSFPDGQVATEVLPYAEALCDSIRAHNPCAVPMFYMTWGRKNGDASNCTNWPPVCTYEGMDSILHANYLKMGKQNDGEVAAVGAAWRYLRSHSPSIELYTGDGSHPSLNGSFAAAYAFYSTIFRKSPYTPDFQGGLSQTTFDSIRKAVDEAVFKKLNDYNVGVNDPDINIQYTVSQKCTFTFTSSLEPTWSLDLRR